MTQRRNKQEELAQGLVGRDIYTVLYRAMVDAVPQVLGQFVRDGADAVDLRIKRQDSGEWLAIGRRFGEDGTPEVIFGWGYDLVAALVALNAGIGAGRWKPDRPWRPD